MGKGYFKMVESVSCLSVSLDEWCCINEHSSHVFGTLCSTSDDEQDREPSTADLLRAKRTARKTRQEAQQPQAARGRTPGVSLRLFSHTSVVCL
jgi:hypothetical protein